MSRDAYEDIAQNLTDKMKSTLTPANDGVFSKNCLGVVTAKGGICIHCRYLQKVLLVRKSKLEKKRFALNWPHRLRVANQEAKRSASRLCTLAGQILATEEKKL
ncbi:uncharacterized protein LOC142776300 [Rhipicephalus microplus]|uniref:uncharacterized protein LOC142776300 n=1 Tax=Rhipicephalus microplus TaxID=6941 RepID=UPI003F6C4BC7